jgi:hypothetical protein
MKDVYTLFNETLAEIRKSPAKEKKFRSLVPLGAKVPVEVQLNCAKEVLAGKVEEAQRTTTKHNGEADNATEFQESADSFSEATDPREKQVAGYMAACAITEAEARSVLRLAPKEIVELGRQAVVDYEFGKACNLSEAQAIESAKRCRA